MPLFEDGMMTAVEAASFVGCSVNFLRIRARDGRIKCYRLGKLYRFRAEDLQILIVTQDPTYNANNSLE